MKTQQEIEKEFDERLLILMSEDFPKNAEAPRVEATRQFAKSFIRQVRQDDIKNLIEWAESKKRMEVDRLIYNQALDDIISHLQSQLKELN